MSISFINPQYRSNIIFAIYQYQILKPYVRIEEVKKCLLIARAEHRSHRILRYALEKYLANITTGFHLFGASSLPVKTGHSLLRKSILAALDSMPESELIAYELQEEERIHSLDGGSSRDELLLKNANLSSELIMTHRTLEAVQASLNEGIIEYKIIAAEKKKLEEKLAEAILRGDKLSVENRQINHNLLEIIAEKNSLADVNKKLLQKLGGKSLTKSTSGFFSSTTAVTPL